MSCGEVCFVSHLQRRDGAVGSGASARGGWPTQLAVITLINPSLSKQHAGTQKWYEKFGDQSSGCSIEESAQLKQAQNVCVKNKFEMILPVQAQALSQLLQFNQLSVCSLGVKHVQE